MLLCVLAACSAGKSDSRRPQPPPAQPEEQVRRIHHAALTIDAHIDLRPDFNKAANDAGGETIDQFDLPKLERGDLDVATVALFADPQRRTPASIATARAEVGSKRDAVRGFIAAHADRVEQARSADDIERLAAAGKHAVLFSFLNAFWLAEDLSDLPRLYDDGVRVFGFVHLGDNAFAASSRPVAAFGDEVAARGGLTPLGQRAVHALNDLGVVVDVSQLTSRGVLDAVAHSRTPVIASHSGVKGLVDAPRNLSDDELRAIAAAGGCVHVVAFHAWLRTSEEANEVFQRDVLAPFGLARDDDAKAGLDPSGYTRFIGAYTAYSRGQWRYASLTDYVDSIDYAVRIAGADHVGISSDFNHGGGVRGFASVADAPNVTKELLRRGYSEADIRKLWGGNFLRVLRAAETHARDRRTPRPG